MQVGFLLENQKERDDLGDLEVGGRVILKFVIKIG
jgi:hypothetical protein